MNFYTSVIIIFLLILLIILVLFYFLFKSKNSTLNSKYNSCPDYWTLDINTGNCMDPEFNGNLNAGNVYGNIIATPYKYNQTPLAAISNNGRLIDFNNPSWYKDYNTYSLQCAWQKWANSNNIEWSGITNVYIPDCTFS